MYKWPIFWRKIICYRFFNIIFFSLPQNVYRIILIDLAIVYRYFYDIILFFKCIFLKVMVLFND